MLRRVSRDFVPVLVLVVSRIAGLLDVGGRLLRVRPVGMLSLDGGHCDFACCVRCCEVLARVCLCRQVPGTAAVFKLELQTAAPITAASWALGTETWLRSLAPPLMGHSEWRPPNGECVLPVCSGESGALAVHL